LFGGLIEYQVDQAMGRVEVKDDTDPSSMPATLRLAIQDDSWVNENYRARPSARRGG